MGQRTTQVIHFLTILLAAYPVPPHHDLDVEASRYSEYCKLLTELGAHIFLENPHDLVATRVTSEPLVVEDSLDRKSPDLNAAASLVEGDMLACRDEQITDALKACYESPPFKGASRGT